MKNFIRLSALVVTTLLTFSSLACTGIGLTANDGSVIYGRTLEFGENFDSDLLVVPRNYTFTGQATDQATGIVWKNKYAFVGTNASKTLAIVDGLNEKGLAVGLFYFPGYAEYQKITPADYKNSLAAWQLGSWLLGNCANTTEVRARITHLKVTSAILPAWGFAPPVHFFVRDASGKSLVIEYFAGKLHVYNDPINILTNSPTFPWHMANIKNYLNLTPNNVQPITYGNFKLAPAGQGSGMVGLPGDFTPPSRFIRAAILTHSSQDTENAQQTVDQAFHILNQFDIPKGVVREENNKQVTYEYTLWTSVADLTHKKYYIHTEQDRQIRVVDLMQQNLDATNIIAIPLTQAQNILELNTTDGVVYTQGKGV